MERTIESFVWEADFVSACHDETREFPIVRYALGGETVVKAEAAAAKSRREIVFCIIFFNFVVCVWF